MVRKTFLKQDKLAVVQDLETGKTVAQVCREHGIKPDAAYRWKHDYEKDPVNAFAGKGKASSYETKCAELERTVGQMHMQIEFLKKVQKALQQQLVESKNER